MSAPPVPVTIFHNPSCGTSRNTLALIRNAGIEPRVIEYLKTPPDRATLRNLLQRMAMTPRQLLREKGTPYAELGLAAAHWSDEQLLDQMLAHLGDHHPQHRNGRLAYTRESDYKIEPAAELRSFVKFTHITYWKTDIPQPK